jgi:CheY-like chemotaxis protein
LGSEVGKGTSITLFLPRATALPAARSDGGENAPPAVSVRVLVVEDDIEVAAVTAELLRDIGYQPIEAHDGYGALAILERDPAIEFVLSDIVMAGGISGFDLARTLRERRPELPVLLATGYSRYARQVVEEGFELVEKPYHREALTVSIKAALGRARSGRSIAAGATEATLRT